MTLIYLKDTEANEVRGAYKANHELQPVEYDKDFNLLGKDDIDRIQDDLSTDIKLKLNDKAVFVVGDGSKEDLQYQAIVDSWAEIV